MKYYTNNLHEKDKFSVNKMELNVVQQAKYHQNHDQMVNILLMHMNFCGYVLHRAYRRGKSVKIEKGDKTKQNSTGAQFISYKW